MASSKRRKQLSFPKLHEQMEKIKAVFPSIEQNEQKTERTSFESSNYKDWIFRIVASVENTGKVDKYYYHLMVENYPQTKEIIENLIEEVKLYSIYDFEPSVVNFDFSAYLLKIKQIIE